MSNRGIGNPYTSEELAGLPTLAIGQADDLKVDDGENRWWLARCESGDGETRRVHHEQLVHGCWVVVGEYEELSR